MMVAAFCRNIEASNLSELRIADNRTTAAMTVGSEPLRLAWLVLSMHWWHPVCVLAPPAHHGGTAV
jgi:hypothetical protein